MRSKHVTVFIDLDSIRASAERIRAQTGVALIAVIKADAYGLGAKPVADVLDGVADEFAYFYLHEAREVGRPGIVLGPPEGDPAEYQELDLRPAVGTAEEARRYAGIPAAVNLDTGMQRFGCPPEALDDVVRACDAREVFTHAGSPAAAESLAALCAGRSCLRHAASTSLLDCPPAYLDAVRPGLALYRGAARVTTRLAAVREPKGPIGYTEFRAERVGVLLAGYSQGLRPGPVMLNGREQRVLEVGMNTSFVSVSAEDRVGAEVVLLGTELPEAELACRMGVREHEVLCRYTAMGTRVYSSDATSARVRRRSTLRAPSSEGAHSQPAPRPA